MLKVSNADYIIITEFKGGLETIRELKTRKYEELRDRYKIKEGTCLAALLEELVSYTPPEEDREDEFIPYQYLLNSKKFERWSKDTVRRNIKRLTELGAASFRYWDDIAESRRKHILKFRGVFLGEWGIDLKEVYSKVIVPTERISTGEFDKLEDLYDEMVFIPGILGGICCASEEDATSIDDSRTILKEDIRQLPFEKRIEKLMELYRKFVKPRKPFEGEKFDEEGYGYEERRRVTNEYAQSLQNMPHLKGVDVVGSLALGDDGKRSDIDLLLCRYHCPGGNACLEKLPQSDIFVDIFCFTPEEIEELKREGALITYFAVPYDQWRKDVAELKVDVR